MPSHWTRIRLALDPIARALNHYTAYRLDPAEYVHDAAISVRGARTVLRDRGYGPQYLSAAKRHPGTGTGHALSYRRVPTTHPDSVEGSRLARGFDAGECQYHVHVFEVDGGVEFYSHYEVRPDLVALRVSLERLRVHYRPVVGETYHHGVTDLPE